MPERIVVPHKTIQSTTNPFLHGTVSDQEEAKLYLLWPVKQNWQRKKLSISRELAYASANVDHEANI